MQYYTSIFLVAYFSFWGKPQRWCYRMTVGKYAKRDWRQLAWKSNWTLLRSSTNWMNVQQRIFHLPMFFLSRSTDKALSVFILISFFFDVHIDGESVDGKNTKLRVVMNENSWLTTTLTSSQCIKNILKGWQKAESYLDDEGWKICALKTSGPSRKVEKGWFINILGGFYTRGGG